MTHKDISEYIEAARSLDDHQCAEDMELMLRAMWEMLPADYKTRFDNTDEALTVLADARKVEDSRMAMAKRVEELQALFAQGEESPRYPREDWSYEADSGDTRLDYWEWLAHKYEADQRDPKDDAPIAPAP